MRLGPRFSNLMLQCLLTYLKKMPEQENHRIIIIGTTSEENLMQNLGLWECFNLKVEIPKLKASYGEVSTALSKIVPELSSMKFGQDFTIPIKSLYFIANTLRQRMEEDSDADLQAVFRDIYAQTQGLK